MLETAEVMQAVNCSIWRDFESTLNIDGHR